MRSEKLVLFLRSVSRCVSRLMSSKERNRKAILTASNMSVYKSTGTFLGILPKTRTEK